jgi:hypothetical protein
MTYVTIAGLVVCGWALLSVLGGERQRRLREREAGATGAAPDVSTVAESRADR